MMNLLIEYAREKGFKCLTGNLATIDLNHKDRLHHFYKKFDFEIIEYEQRNENFYGKIIKVL